MEKNEERSGETSVAKEHGGEKSGTLPKEGCHKRG